MNKALPTMAPIAARATRPATVSLGLCNRMRIARLGSVSTSTAAAFAPRRRRPPSFLAEGLGTLLHQSTLFLKFVARRRHEGSDLAFGWLGLLLHAHERQLDGDGCTLAEPALHRQLAGMQRNQA